MNSDNLYGLLFDYEYCTGCHACEVACKKEHGYEKGQCGIHVLSLGPNLKPNGKWELDYIPVPGDLCDLCTKRTVVGKKPSCVHHCQSLIIQYGTVSELATKVDKRKMSIFVPTGE